MGCGTSRNTDGSNISKGPRQIHRTENSPSESAKFIRRRKSHQQNTDVGQCAPVEAIIKNGQPPISAEMSGKNQKEFDENMEKWEAGLAAPERNKAKKLLKRYACAFAMNNRKQGRTGMVKHEIDTGEARPIKQAPRSISLAKRSEVKELVDEMKRAV